MYGVIIQNLAEYVRKSFGNDEWAALKKACKCEEDNWGLTDIIPEGIVVKMGKTAQKQLGVSDEEFYEGMGVYFIGMASDIGYGTLLAGLGRRFRDFVLNLDNLHDYQKFTFPRMKAPSFFIAIEDTEHVIMEYRSKRRGFHYYVQGMMKEISKAFAKEIRSLGIMMKKQEVIFDTVVTTYEMRFRNQGYEQAKEAAEKRKDSSMPVRASVIFEMFPFCVLFNSELTVSVLGVSLRQIIPKLMGTPLNSYFEIIKPLVEFKWDVIMSRTNNMWELATVEEIDQLGGSGGGGSSSGGFGDGLDLDLDDQDKTLHIKGQMVYMPDWDQLLFLACPMMKDLNNLIWSGLFVNDLSMHDYSRDIMLATSQEQIEIKMALKGAEQKTSALNNQLKKLDEVTRKSEEMLHQMIPKKVAQDLAKGKTALEICENYDLVTMLFSDVVTFTVICSRLQPAQVVQLLNNMYTLFDFLCDQNAVYKVETIGDAYLIVAGVPIKASNHALKIVDMAFDMMDGISMLTDPGTGKEIYMRIGCHSGPVVAGVVGLKMPRYCLFGLNVALTEKFESNSKPMRIHISEPCKNLLGAQYKTEERTDEGLKDKVGGHNSFFLNEKEGRKPLSESVIKALLPTEKESGGKKAKEAKKEDAKPAAKADAAPAASAAAPPPPSAAAPPPPSSDPKPAADSAPAPSAAPDKPAEDKKEEAAAPAAAAPEGGGDGGGDAPAPAAAEGGGEAAPAGEEAAPEAAAEPEAEAEAAPAAEAAPEDDARPVSTVQQTQCCAGVSKTCVLL